MEGSDLDVNQVYGELVRELVQEGKFTNEEIGMILNEVEEKVKILSEWYEKMGM
jgi:polyhydroxyalkanoate synthesis regulator phasin